MIENDGSAGHPRVTEKDVAVNYDGRGDIRVICARKKNRWIVGMHTILGDHVILGVSPEYLPLDRRVSLNVYVPHAEQRL